jgi:hypothetical protein
MVTCRWGSFFLSHTVSHRSILLAILFIVSLLAFALPCEAQVKRVVILKFDGLPYDAVDSFVNEQDPRTGKSQLPWIKFIFYDNGSRLQNFYVRGMSLSAPSWSLLETGQHLQIKGNVEFDRYTQKTYDYLNFVPYIVNSSRGVRVDMPGVEVLDSLGEPLLIDAFPHDQRYTTFSLFQRGPRFITFQRSLENKFKRAPKEIFDEWTMGLGMREVIPQELIRETIANLAKPNVRYLDLALTDYDHASHHNNDRETHLLALKQIDSVLGEIWTAIQKSPYADETALIVVSDHGANSDPRVYSQGYNLVKLLGSPEGGGHHVITKRRLMLDYSLKGMNPFISLITTTTNDSYYLKKQSTEYPTAMLDFDGNERASIHLRDSDFNVLHLMLQQLQRKDISDAQRKAATDEFFKRLDARRAGWQQTLAEVNEELGALGRAIEKQRALWESRQKKFTPEEIAAGKDDATKRIFAQLDRWTAMHKDYTDYVRVMDNLLSLNRENFNPMKLKIEDVIAKKAMGDRNGIEALQHYVVGLGPAGLVVNADGSLDTEKSFVHVNYFALLDGISVRNNVQSGISNQPVDIVATRIPSIYLSKLNESDLAPDAVWVYGGQDQQALILARRDSAGRLSFKYQPIRRLTQTNGDVSFEIASWQKDFPLRIFEDPNLSVSGDRAEWLSQWHTDLEWLRALHRTHYSNGLIGLYEELGQHPVERLSQDEAGISTDDRLLRRLTKRQRELIETDMLIVANNHWNFDVRGFNPGGNHGSFFRVSTHSVLMMAGGQKTNLPRGVVVQEPYDSLSFVPTVLALTGNLRDDSNPVQVLWDKGFRRFPGRVIKEILPETPSNEKIATTEQ